MVTAADAHVLPDTIYSKSVLGAVACAGVDHVMTHFFAGLEAFAKQNGLAEGFTPKDWAQGGDCWHMNAGYGALVLAQIRQALMHEPPQ